jgi:hypothetical protein
MNTPSSTQRERLRERRPSSPSAMKRAQRYQDLARRHRDEESFWLCRASYYGRLSLRS